MSFLIVILISIGSGLTMLKQEKRIAELENEKQEIKSCISDQVFLYSDLCAESSTGWEHKSGTEAYHDGILCAVNSARICMGEEEISWDSEQE